MFHFLSWQSHLDYRKSVAQLLQCHRGPMRMTSVELLHSGQFGRVSSSARAFSRNLLPGIFGKSNVVAQLLQ